MSAEFLPRAISPFAESLGLIPIADSSGSVVLGSAPSSPDNKLGGWSVHSWLTPQGLIFGVMLFAIAPTWFPYASSMWFKGHYQYFPVLLGIVAYLLYGRRAALQERATQPSPWVAGIGLLMVAMVTMFAHLLYSGFLGIFASIMACCTMLYMCFGAGGIRQVWPVLALLVFAIPLPFNLDQSLVVEMQFWASQLAAQLLDGLGVMHFRQGVILVTEKSQFMTEEACSGIRSLFSSLAFVSVLSVMQRHHVLRLIFNLLQTVAWVILGNALRVAAVVMLTDHVSDWFATGAGHEALGMAVFGFILLMVVSTDAFVGMLLFRPLVVDHEAWEQPIGPAPPAPLSASDVEPDPWKPGDAIWGPQSKSLKLAWAGLFLFIGLLGSWVAVVHTGVLEQGLGVIAMPDMPPPAEDDLPVMLGNGWQRTKFEHVKRDINPLLAEESYVYHYARNGRGFVISVDLPWSEWHNLNLCYSNLGWESKPNYFVARPQSGAGASQTELDLSRMDKWAFVIFAVMDRKQRELSPDWRTALQGWRGVLTGVLQQSAASVGLGRDKQIALSGQALPATTIQLLTESGEPFTEQDREEFRVLYDEVRKRLLAGQRWRGQ